MRGEVGREQIDVVGEVFPGAADAGHHGLTAQSSLGADFTRDAGHFGGERTKLLDHCIEGVLEQQDFAANVHRNFFRQIAAGNRGRHFGNIAHLRRQIRRHEVDAVRQILPGAADAGHLRLAAELAFGADLARHAGDFRGKRVELVHHRIDGVLEFENFAFHVHSDLARQVAAGNCSGDFRDVANLSSQIARHRVDAVGQILPGAGHARHVGLTAEAAFGPHLARHARHLTGEPVELVDHGVERLFELQDFAAHVDGDLAREVAAGDRGRHLGNIADLRRQVAGHGVDAVGEVLPGAGNAGHFGLTAELAIGADLARDAGHFAGKRVELVHHGVERFLQLQDFARHVHRDFFRQVALCNGGRDFGDVADLTGEVAGHRVDAVGEVLPRSGHAAHQRLAAQLAFGAHFARDARHFAGEGVELVDHGVERFLQLKDFARHVDSDLLGQVAAGDRGGDVGDVADLRGQVRRHEVDVVGEVLPGARNAFHLRLAAELTFGTDLARYARYFRRKG